MVTTLAAGDIAFTGFNSDNPDEFTFVALTDIEAGTEINFTDNGWFAAGGFRSSEGIFVWTAPANIAAGTVINPAFTGPNFSASGDQIHAYQGDDDTPSFVASVHFNEDGYEADATSSNTSALPSGLTVGTSAIALTETDNGVYSGPLTGTKAELQAAINDPANWTTDNSRIEDVEPAGFKVTDAAPSPSVIINDLDLAADEGGMADSYEVTLSVAPEQPVTITIAAGADLDVAPTELVFDATNFDQPQQVIVTAVDDDLPEAAEVADIQHTVTSGDPAFDGILAPVVEVSISASDIEIVSIYEIQGSGHVSEFVLADGQTVAEFFEDLPAGPSNVLGDMVSTSGIVTAVDSNGFYLQDPEGDGNDATSDAIFVFTGSSPIVSVGDAISVGGTVAEFFPGGTGSGNLPTTQLTNVFDLEVQSSGNALPEAVLIGNDPGERAVPNQSIDDDAFASFDPTQDGIDFFESLEGMRVTATDLQAVSGTSRFGEIFAVADQGSGATGLSERGTLNISPDDFNPEKIQIDEDSGIFDFDFPTVNVGDHLGDVTGVVGYSFGNYEILPTEDFTPNIQSAGLEQETTTLAGSSNELTIATYNVLNLDPNDGDGDQDVADGRFAAIAEQITNNLNSPDIIGLQEVQDNSGSDDDGTVSASETLAELAAAILAAGGPAYEVIDNTFIGDGTSGGQPGGNIRTAFLYNPDRVSLVEGSVQTISGQGEGEAFEGARLPLVADFVFNGETVTVANNHFSSKGGSAPILGTEQDFAARQEDVDVNGSLDERQAQSQAVQDFVNGLGDGANAVVLGDFNEFEFVSPVADLEANTDLVNLTNDIPEDERYSFEFQGNSQSLDHILVSEDLHSGALVDIVHVNSEFAATSGRASDHDPMVASLFIPETQSLAVEFEAGRWFKTKAFESIDGEVLDVDRLGPVRNSLTFSDVGIKVDAIDPTNFELVAIKHGAIGVLSFDDSLFGRDAASVDGDESLRIALEDTDLEAVEFIFSFGDSYGGGDVEVAFYDDGVLVGTMVADVDDGDFSGSLGRTTFDAVELSAIDDTMFTVDEFSFEVIDQNLIA
ncbi:endonuclease/exonuclease/phosphatase family protein [Ruegeria atlantica]|uniref:endonuclease/exonuclease/phosphatase family protein n=1 Tax=Ruegeria atlantica TaxID=81569 RepID=UPI0024943E81|nr:endonuclease/exonuclease/phosphatase family protein [Ruegeria atlantica]